MKQTGRIVILGILAGIWLIQPPAWSFLPGATSKKPEEIKKLIRERRLEKEKSRQRLMERETHKPEPQRVVRIHASGDSSTRRDGDRIVATMDITEEEIRNHDWSKVVAKTHAVRGLPQAVAGRQVNSSPRKVSDSNLNWTILGILGLGALGWWATRREEVT